MHLSSKLQEQSTVEKRNKQIAQRDSYHTMLGGSFFDFLSMPWFEMMWVETTRYCYSCIKTYTQNIFTQHDDTITTILNSHNFAGKVDNSKPYLRSKPVCCITAVTFCALREPIQQIKLLAASGKL